MKYILETERLRLREFTLGDTEFIIELLNSPGWIEFIGDRNVRTHEQALQYLENGPFRSYQKHGFGLCLVERKEDGREIGMCGLLKRASLDHPDIGFAFLPGYNGCGYAFEVASATLINAKEKSGLAKIFAITLPCNKRSINLLEKMGMRYVRNFRFPNSDDLLLLYSN